MDRRENFAPDDIHELKLKLTFGSLEVVSDSTAKLQVMISGDDKDAEDVRVQLKEGVLTVDQPVYGRAASMNLGGEKWLQVFVRIPSAWRGSLSASTVGAPLAVRGISGADLSLDTVSGLIRASGISAIQLSASTVTGMVAVAGTKGDTLTLHAVSGNVVADDLSFRRIRLSSVSGDTVLRVSDPFETIEGSSGTGDISIELPLDRVDAVHRTVTGRMLTDGVSISEGAPKLSISTVSGNVSLAKR